MSSTAPPPTTPGGQKDKSIKESIAALRSILMIDTPTKSLLSDEAPSVAAQQSRYDARKEQWEEIAKLRSTTSELKHRVQEVTNEASLETRKRKTLQTTYDALAKHKKELSVQLELVTKSREAAEEKLDSMRKTLGEERLAMAKERVQWRPEMDRLSREKTKFESKSKELEAQCVSAEQKVQELGQRVNRLEKELSDTKAKLQEKQASQTALQPRVEQSEKARRKAEETLAKVQNELDTIKGRHHKSLTSLLDMQQKIKEDLKQAQEGKKTAEEKLQQAIEDLKEAKQAEIGAVNTMQTTTAEAQSRESLIQITNEKIERLTKELEESEKAKMSLESENAKVRWSSLPQIERLTKELEESEKAKLSLESLNHNANAKIERLKKALEESEEFKTWRESLIKIANEKIERLTKELEGSEEAKTKAEEELERMQNQKKSSTGKLAPPNQDSDDEFESLSSSIVALDNLLHDATEMEESKLTFDFVRRLARVAKQVKSEMNEIQSAKEKAEAKFNVTAAVDKDTEYELASSREDLREARDQLLDSREEAEQLRAEVVSLRFELEKRSGTKRALEDHSESEEDEGDDDEDDDDIKIPSSKRYREDDFDPVHV